MMNRREFLQSAGALVIAFQYPVTSIAAGTSTSSTPTSLSGWLAIGPDGMVTVYCGKVELGTGVLTALSQMVADELDVGVGQIGMIMGDTAVVPDQGVTAGSQTILKGGLQLRQAAATARQVLLGRASTQLNAAINQLSVSNGVVRAPGGKQVTYATLVANQPLTENVDPNVALKTPGEFRWIGRAVPRVDLPAIVFGNYDYLQNVRVAGMRHGRVVRPAMPNATLASVDSSSVNGLPGNVQVVVKGNFVGVVADREDQAIQAATTLKVNWQSTVTLPDMNGLADWERKATSTPKPLKTAGDTSTAIQNATHILQASYSTPYQCHGSVGPSAAIASVAGQNAMIWSATQSSFHTRGSIAALLGIPQANVRLIWVEGSCCYGQNGADDAAADAALMAQLTGQPIRVQWMRADEHGNDPKTPAMTTDLRAALDSSGNITAWESNLYSPSHNGRPDGTTAGMLLAGQALGMTSPNGASLGADRNATHDYQIPNINVVLHQLQSTPIRVSSMRGLGAPHNTFAIESFMDELATAAGADPIDFRLRYLTDPRAIAVIHEVARVSGWSAHVPNRGGRAAGSGRGMAFVHYEGNSTYVAMVMDITMDSSSHLPNITNVYVAHDCGLVINPDGTRNQIEGCVIQGISRALMEQVSFSTTAITSLDWQTYPVLRFQDIPGAIHISLINRPDQPSLGVGEAATVPVYAALANALFDATGTRYRSVPFFAADYQSRYAYKAPTHNPGTGSSQQGTGTSSTPPVTPQGNPPTYQRVNRNGFRNFWREFLREITSEDL